ncbi:MAG: hypothetical protein ACPGFA_01320 [Pikeienuella sp.]
MYMVFGAVLIGGIIGYVAERMRLTHLGFVVAVAVGVGGAVMLSVVNRLFGLNFGLSNGMMSVVGAGILLFIANMRR